MNVSFGSEHELHHQAFVRVKTIITYETSSSLNVRRQTENSFSHWHIHSKIGRDEGHIEHNQHNFIWISPESNFSCLFYPPTITIVPATRTAMLAVVTPWWRIMMPVFWPPPSLPPQQLGSMWSRANRNIIQTISNGNSRAKLGRAQGITVTQEVVFYAASQSHMKTYTSGKFRFAKLKCSNWTLVSHTPISRG